MEIETLSTSFDVTEFTFANRLGQLTDSYSEHLRSASGPMPDNEPDPGPPPHPPPTKPLPAPPKPPTKPRSLLPKQSGEQHANFMPNDNATSNADFLGILFLKCPPAPSIKPSWQSFGPHPRHMDVRAIDNGRCMESCLTGQRPALAAAAQ